MKIATWNLERVRPGSGERTRRIGAAIADVEADLWVLTETHRLFAPGSGYREVAFSSAANDREEGEQWVSIWVRSEIGAVALEVVGEPERSAAARIVFDGGGHLIVFGTVLPWRSDTATELRGAAKFERSLAAQVGDWERLRALYPDDSFCLAGDFNQELLSNRPVGTRRGRAALVAALHTHSLVAVTGGEHDPLLARGWGESIDHIVLDRALAATAKVVALWPDEFPLPQGMPDHYGVCVEFGEGEHREISIPKSAVVTGFLHDL